MAPVLARGHRVQGALQPLTGPRVGTVTSPMDRGLWDGRLRPRGRPPEHVRGFTAGSSVPPGAGATDRPRETPLAHA